MKFTTTKSNSDPAQNHSLHFRNQKGKNLVWKNPTIATRKTCALHVTACAYNLSSPPSRSSMFKKTVIPLNEIKWKAIPANSSYGGALSLLVSKMVTRMVHHYDQEEREPDGSYHWDTVRRVLLKAFGKHGAHNFTKRYWIQLIQEGSSKKSVEYCVDHRNSFNHLRAIQGHSGGIPIMPELMGYTSVPYNWKQYICHRGCS